MIRPSVPSRFIEAPNARLIGVPGGRSRLLTPALVLDLDIFERNLAKMQARCGAVGIALRPHAKAHKCVEIARRQIAAGAVGICVATPGEAEVFSRAGIGDILLTSTFGTEVACERLVAAAAGATLTLVLDNPAIARLLATQARAAGLKIPVLIDIDMGRHRSGVATPEDAVQLAKAIASEDSLILRGVQAYAGHLSHCETPAARKDGAAKVDILVRRTLEAVAPYLPAGQRPVVTGCSTGALNEELALGLYTEVQCGSYALMDVEYDAIDPDGSGVPAFETSLCVTVSVTSSNHPGLATTDGGEKRFAAKKAATLPRILSGAPDGAVYRPSSDEHGAVQLPDGARLAPGSLIDLQVPHCDPTVNLYDFIHAVRGGTVEAIWPIDARGM